MKTLQLLILLAPFVLFSGATYVTASNDVSPTWTYYTDGPVDSIAISSDGTHFVSGSKSVDGGTIYYFDNQGKVIWQSTQDRQILSVTISDDGSYVAAAGSQFYHYGTYGPAGYNKGMVYFFDKTGNLLWKYDTNSEAALQVSVTFDGSNVVVDTSGGILYLNKDGKLLWSHNDNSINDHPVKITKDGSLIATKDDQKLLVFEKNGTLLWEKTEDNWGAFAFSDDGRFLATSADPSGIDLLDRNGRIIWKDGVGMHFLSTSLSENGSYIAASAQQWGQDNPGGLFLIDNNARVLWQLPGDGYSAISSDGSFIAMGLWTQDSPSVLLYNKDGDLLWQHASGLVHSVAISHDGKYVIAGIGDSNYGDGSVQLFTNEPTLSELNATAHTKNENLPVIITQVELNSPYKPIPQDISCMQWNKLADQKLVPYFCTENVVPKEAVECGYPMMSPHICNPVHETYNFTDICPFHSGFLPNGTPIVEKYAKGDQWIIIYNTQDKPVDISNFNMKWNSTGFYENYEANFSLTLSPHEQCSLVGSFVESTNGTALIQYKYQGNNYVFKTPQLVDAYNDAKTWQYDENKWIFAEQNTVKVPEWKSIDISTGPFTEPMQSANNFDIQYRTINGTGTLQAHDYTFVTNTYSKTNGMFEIKIPRNFPYYNGKDGPSENEKYIISENGADLTPSQYDKTVSDCFFTYSIPFYMNSTITVESTDTLYLMTPIYGDKIPDYCMSKTMVPEFPYVQIILIMSIMSTIVFYRVKLKK